MSLLELAGVSAGYDGSLALRSLSLRIEPGEVVALLGPNGAGKTTTLLAVSGLVAVTEGTIAFDGRPLAGRRASEIARAGVAHVTEDRALFSALTVRQNLQLAARSRRASRIEGALIHFPALEALLERKAGLLSGGEQQMLAIGRALLTKPTLLMIDEMSLGLAPIIVARLLPIVKRIAESDGCGVLLVEQHVSSALAVADRAYLLAHGDLVMEGPAAEFLDNRSLVEAGYLGSDGLPPPVRKDTQCS